MRHSLDVIHCARQDYAEGRMTVEGICRKHGMSRHVLYTCLGGGALGGDHDLPLIPRRGTAARSRRRRRLSGDRVEIVRRLWRTAEAQVRDIEDRLLQDKQEPDQRERDARVLAVLVKTLRELSALNESQGETPTTAGDDDEVPRDIDEFRRELARRMDAFVESRTGAGIPRE